VEPRVLKEGDLFIVSDELGDIPEVRRRLGLYYRDTRYLSIFELTVNGQKPRLMASSCRQNCVCDKQLANPTLELPDGTSALARTISIQRSRFLSGGLHERITLYNYNPFPVPLSLGLSFASDFLDIFEIRGMEREKRGTLHKPDVSDSRLLLRYEGLDDVTRTTEVVFDVPPTSAKIEEPTPISLRRATTFLPESIDVASVTLFHPPAAKVLWNLTLQAREPLCITLRVFAREEDVDTGPADFNEQLTLSCQRYDDWGETCTLIETDNELFNQLLERSVLDMQMLMSPTPAGPIPVAGIPWYACIKGPNACVTALQTLMLNPQIAVNTLRYLAQTQGVKSDPLHEEEPGKIVHEIRRGELAWTGETPHSAFYGSIDATPLFLILFAETMKWLGDDELYRELLPAAKSALEWIQCYGDIDGDNYVEYVTRGAGTAGGGWRDSRGIVAYPDGGTVPEPLKLVQVQGYTYKAMMDMSELLASKGEDTIARGLAERARALKESFNRDFWMDKLHYLAEALDSSGQRVSTVTSKAGHCLYCGIVDEEKARYIVARLSSTDMACGWGICTVSRRDDRFNAMSYRGGSVWPHDNSLIVAGMKRHGYHWEVEEIATQLFEASQHFDYNRLPELYCGFPRNREAHSVPAEYPVACNPYGMAAGSAILLFQSMLGLEVDAAAKHLYLTPRLPNWIQHATVRNLRIGDHTVNLHFDRRADVTRFDISDNEAGVEVIIPPG